MLQKFMFYICLSIWFSRCHITCFHLWIKKLVSLSNYVDYCGNASNLSIDVVRGRSISESLEIFVPV